MTKKIKDYTDDERKAYFRNHYHKHVNTADRKSITRICRKEECIKLLIEEIGIIKILELHTQLFISTISKIKLKKL